MANQLESQAQGFGVDVTTTTLDKAVNWAR